MYVRWLDCSDRTAGGPIWGDYLILNLIKVRGRLDLICSMMMRKLVVLSCTYKVTVVYLIR
jgi:hypothetical protein